MAYRSIEELLDEVYAEAAKKTYVKFITMMGCEGLKTKSMAEAFIQKGAKAYIGWDDYVISQYVDEATIKLLEYMVLEKHLFS